MEQNITLQGSVMIRQVFDTKEVQVSNDNKINEKLHVKVYPIQVEEF